jgi:hypothetical protein
LNLLAFNYDVANRRRLEEFATQASCDPPELISRY